MGLRVPVRSLVAAVTVLLAAAGGAPVASAQGYGYRDYDRFDGPRYSPRWDRGPYRGRYDRYDDVEPNFPRRARRWRDQPVEDNEDFIEYQDGTRVYRDPDAPAQQARPQPLPRPRPQPVPEQRRSVDDDFDEPDGGDEILRRRARRDTAREPAFDDEQAKAPGLNGGPQPSIEPVAPPRVAFAGGFVPGSIVIDTSRRKLYYVTGMTSAYAYPIGVGREGFSWNGAEKVSRVADWPDWYPPAEMRKRKPELPEKMTGGLNNPLGAKAIYLGNTLYRIHGTNDPKSIGKAESSGCFRMLNQHVTHLASLVQTGTPVTVVQSLAPKKVAAKLPAKPRISGGERSTR
ncbi:MAG: L,D-transpeptidase [Hyphomicrobium sp.]|nr:L,D-transpeptidase [Hyphomicrobium sp.]